MVRQPLARRLLSALLGLLVLGSTLAPPLLDAGERTGEVRIEGEHDPARCGVLHDHAACAHLAKSFASPAARALAHVRVGMDARDVRGPEGLDVSLRPDTPTPAPRAPPAPLL